MAKSRDDVAEYVMVRACVSDHVIVDYWQEHALFQGHDNRCFRYRPQSLIHERSPQRLDLVQALVDNPRVWEIPTTMFSARFGMPDSREALAAWLAQHIPDR
jgi:hypothetical protein